MRRCPPVVSHLSVTLSFILALISLATPQCVFGQAGGASISGRISDSSGAVVLGAELSIKNVATNVTALTTTNSVGLYSFPSLPPGNYVLTVHKRGFRSEDLIDLTLYTQDEIERNFTLTVGSISESVTVSAGVTNTSPAVSLTVTREFIENMPLNGRSLQDLIQLAPGTVSTQDGYYSINGQREDSNNYTVDGVSANLGGLNNSPTSSGSGFSGSAPSQTALGTTQSLTSIDGLQEFKIQTSGYAAEYGRNPGGQVQFTTRSGTNEVHGTLYEYLRNTALDANSYENNYYGNKRTAEHQNDFGGTVGGPLVVPKLYNGRNKTFYFFSYEGLRLLLPHFENTVTPTQAFREWAAPSIRPYLDASALPNGPENQDGCTIPDSATGQQVACDASFTYGYSAPNNLDNISSRIDHNFGEHLHAFVRYADTPSFEKAGAEAVQTTAINSHSWTAGLTANITSTMLDDFRFNYSHDGEQFVETQRAIGGSVPVERNLLIPAAYDSSYATGQFGIYVPNSSLFAVPIYDGSGTVQHQYQFVDSLVWTRGKHRVSFGGDWRHLTPSYTGNSYTSVAESLSLADIQQGYATTVVTEANAPGRASFDNLSLYTQDHWQILPSVSIDYGLRWEFNPPPGPSNGYYPVTLTTGNLANAQLTNDVGTEPYKTVYRSFAPRFGFAWNAVPSTRHSLTVRGGFGLFYDTGQNVIGNSYISAYPFQATSPTQTEVPLPLSGAVLAPPSLNVPLTTPYPFLNALSDPNLALPYTEQWNLSLDEGLSSRNTLTMSYVGNNGRKLLFTGYYASVPSNANFSSLNLTTNGSQSGYNALQVQDVGRITNGLDLVASFAWAHALDNASNDYSFAVPIWGNSDNDLRRVLNLALNYQTPTAGGSIRWMQLLSHGWLLANRFSAQSGYPLNITQSFVILPSGTQSLYTPDLLPNAPIYLHGQAADVNGVPTPAGWRLNSAAFALVPTDSVTGNPVRQGTLGRNYVRNPSFYALNTALQRSFSVYDELHLNFRVEAFNIFNHPSLADPDPTLSDSTFGQLEAGTTKIGSSNSLYSMGAARSLQLSLKLQF